MNSGTSLLLTSTGKSRMAAVLEIWTDSGKALPRNPLYGVASIGECLAFIEQTMRDSDTGSKYDGLRVEGFAESAESVEDDDEDDDPDWVEADLAAHEGDAAPEPRPEPEWSDNSGLDDDDPTGADERELELAAREGDA